MAESKLVSAVITTCKRKPDIVLRAVKSVLNQNYGNIELIVVDDSPADYPLREAVRCGIMQLSPDAVVVQNAEQLGACGARNVGLNRAGGEYIAFLDDDDEWLPEKIEKQVEKIAQCPETVAMIYCGYCKSVEDRDKITTVEFVARKGKIYNDLICKGNFCGGMSMPLIRTDCLKKIGGFDEYMPAMQDYDLWLRIARAYEIDYVAEALVIYYWHSGEQITKNPDNKINGLKRIIEKNSGNISRQGERRFNLVFVKYYIKKHEKRQARRYLKRAAEISGLTVRELIKYFFMFIKG